MYIKRNVFISLLTSNNTTSLTKGKKKSSEEKRIYLREFSLPHTYTAKKENFI